MAEPTYIFQNGNVYTLVDGRVVSSVKEADFADPAVGGHPIHGEVQMPDAPGGIQDDLGSDGVPCPTCGSPTSAHDQYCPQCGSPIADSGAGQFPQGDAGAGGIVPSGQMIAKTVTTPNGLRGRVLARVPGIWGDEVTVRFENGVIRRIPVDKRLTFASEEVKASDSPVKSLEERLASSTQTDRDSLSARASELEDIKIAAGKLVASSSDGEAATLNCISVEADFELREVKAALEHYADLEGKGFEPPAPIENVPTVEQTSMNGTDANWLDATLGEMTTEAAGRDYTKLMDEGPEEFIAGLDDAQLADAGTTRAMASYEIRSHTAGADEKVRVNYERVWLARVELQRRERLASRKEEVRKEASSPAEEVAPPDESLFM